MQVYIFGAGASAAEGAPATRDFFAQAWRLLAPTFDERIRSIWCLLEDLFGIPITGPDAFAYLPAVDEVVSLVDWSLHVNQGLGRWYDPPRLYQARRDLEHLLCVTLDAALATRPDRERGPHARFVSALLSEAGPDQSALLSLNYDTFLDDALVAQGVEPEYGLGLADLQPERERGPLLAKLHGSLNWALCHACGHITVAREQVAHRMPHVEGLRCCRCENDRLHGLIISPTWLKRYDCIQLQHIWDLALESIQQAERITFVGYSLPPADVAIHQVIRRGLLTSRQARRPQIRVINHHKAGASAADQRRDEAAVISRFTQLFGPEVVFDFSGFHGQT